MFRIAQFDIHHTRFLYATGDVVGDLPEFARDAGVRRSLYRVRLPT